MSLPPTPPLDPCMTYLFLTFYILNHQMNNSNVELLSKYRSLVLRVTLPFFINYPTTKSNLQVVFIDQLLIYLFIKNTHHIHG